MTTLYYLYFTLIRMITQSLSTTISLEKGTAN